ncbi:MAG: tryptophan synthase alpha chain, partial [Polyangiales bacterium]
GDTTSCTKKTCAELGITCGLSGDGCGGTQDCGTCPTPDAGSGCTPLTCGGRCGPQGDGCGGILTCPACDGGTCIPTTCAKAGADCGNYPDGCGGLLNCGTCTAPATCGGGGVANKCGGIK